MELLTRALYLLSTGLLVPVVVLLLLLFARSLLLAGRTWGDWRSRLRFRSALRPLLDRLDRENVDALLRGSDLPAEPQWKLALRRLLDHGQSAAQREKAVTDFEAGCEEDLAAARTMARLGPMLGLMGTLIPMGPALVGLAAGDIAAMAENLQVAFSTTVVGLFVGGIGFAIQQAKQRWHAEALADLEFVSGLVGERNAIPESGDPNEEQQTATPHRRLAS